MNEIYGFVGQIGAGKTFHALKEVERLKKIGRSTLMISWADPIKQFIQDEFYMTKRGFLPGGIEQLRKVIQDSTCAENAIIFRFKDLMQEAGLREKGWSIKEIVWMYSEAIQDALNAALLGKYSLGFRKLIQLLGTEIGRTIDENFWVKVVLKRIENVFNYSIAQAVVIDDIRFANEYENLIEFAFDNNIKLNVKAVAATLDTRAARTGYTAVELAEFSTHGSESGVMDIIKRIPNENIIFN